MFIFDETYFRNISLLLNVILYMNFQTRIQTVWAWGFENLNPKHLFGQFHFVKQTAADERNLPISVRFCTDICTQNQKV